MTDAILLVAHGARDPRWAGPIESIKASLERRLPDARVSIAYLEFLQPSIPEALTHLHRERVRKLRIVPIFLGSGGHVTKDIAGLVSEVQAMLPELEIALEPPIGSQAQVIEAIASAIAG